ncbi:MAG: phosphopyruvate hydratase [Candidatus Levybacteria bacterium]|nr:phosphopyruvate hydratase [Candidatus Levybacteria bacterium]
MIITNVQSLEILDSRGNPTVRTLITLEDNSVHSSSVPSGASTGSHEAVELRDEDNTRYMGKGVLTAVENVNTTIKDAIVGMEADPNTIDSKLLQLDGTENKANLGANAILSVSQAVVRAAAHTENVPLWKFMFEYYFKDQSPNTNHHSPSFPQLLVNIVNGGKHASWNFDIQEFMVVPNIKTPSESVRIAAEIFHSLGKVLKARKLSTLVGDEGGFSPQLNSNEEVLDAIIEAAKNAGYENVKDFRLSLDVASTEFFKDGKYELKKQNKWLSPEELTTYYTNIGQKYNILSFEDAFAEDDWEAWTNFTDMAEKFKFITIGDDLLVTNPERIRRAIDEKAANAVLVKVNQIGTIKETVEAINMAHSAGWKTAISHRSGETEDSFIADLAYACGSEFIKTGSMSRSERLAKYNRLLEIENGL